MLVRLALAAGLAVAALAAPSAYADPADPPCQLSWEPFIQGEGPVLEHVSVGRPKWTC